MTLEERRELCNNAKVTLDGKPACIRGAYLDFAIVAEYPTGPKYEWAWDTVKRIVARDGKFRS